jgi:hypothetical protein
VTITIFTAEENEDRKSTTIFDSLKHVSTLICCRETNYYRDGSGEGKQKKETDQFIQKQFKLRRGSSASESRENDPEVSAAEMEAIRKSRLIAAASTSVKIAGLKLAV